MKSQALTFPAPITYIGKVKVTSTKEKASGFYDELNKEQFNALQAFKEQLRGLTEKKISLNFDEYDDLYLLRFLRAKKFNVKDAMEMFQNFLKWRKTHKVDDIRKNFVFEEMFKVKPFYPHGYHKTDKMGRPIYIELLSKVNMDKLLTVTTEKSLKKYYIREYERLIQRRLPACSAELKKPVEQSLTILDLEGIGITHLVGKTKELLEIALGIGQNYYPEMIGTMMLLNTSFAFNAVWTFVQPFIDEKTRKKINVLGTKYQSKLLEIVDKENLPSILGGTCTCSHIEKGCLYSDIGPWNPRGGIKEV